MKIGLDQIYNGNISEVVHVDIVTESISPTVAVAKSVPKTQLIKEDACLIKIKDGLYVDIDNIRGLSDRIKLKRELRREKKKRNNLLIHTTGSLVEQLVVDDSGIKPLYPNENKKMPLRKIKKIRNK